MIPGGWQSAAAVPRRLLAGLCLAALASATPAVAAGLRLERVEAGLPGAGQWRNGFALADLDGDGHLDLVHGPPRKGQRVPVVFRGDGAGRFSPWAGALFPDLPFDYGDTAAADFDRDGRTDLAFAVHLGGLTALRGDGAGAFRPADEGLELLPAGRAQFSSRCLAAADWDGDARTDLVALGEGPAPRLRQGRRGLAVFRNLGEGRWQRLPGPDDSAFGDSFALGDLDGDGRTDAVIASRRLDDQDLLRLQQADGTWRIAPLAGVREDSYFPAVTVLEREGAGVRKLALSWVERRDGGWRSGIDIVRLSESGWKRTALTESEGVSEIRALAAGDLDGDGVTDLVAGDETGALRIYRGRRSGDYETLATRPLGRAGAGCSARAARLADLDGDGRPELIVAFASEPEGQRCPDGGSLQVWRSSGV